MNASTPWQRRTTIARAANQALEAAIVIASVVISPLIFLGASLLYVDQTARVE